MKKNETKERILREEFTKDFFDSMFYDMLSNSQKEAIFRAMEMYLIISTKQNKQ